ncbi:MAG: M23 family metallopeptidase [Myxococcaceae bacterium]
MSRFTLALLLLALPAAGQEPTDPSSELPPARRAEGLAVGRAFTRMFLDDRADALWANLTPSARAVFGSVERLRSFRAKVLGDFGQEVRLLSESHQQRRGLTVYVRSSLTARYARGMELRIAYDDGGAVSELSVRGSTSAAPTVYLGRKAKTRLRLPFEGPWAVLWGGSEWADNRHTSVSDQRFAYDFLAMKGGKSYLGAGRTLEQYHCFGRKVLAPGDGTVVTATDGIPDNLPGTINALQLYGNHLVIEHGNGEYSLLAHLKRGSLAVKPGSKVKAGDLVGQAGSSGTSTEPHLHYQLMDGPDYLRAHGMPSQFHDYLSDGRPVDRGEPARSATVVPRDRETLTSSKGAR